MHKAHKKVLFFQRAFGNTNRASLNGVYRYARKMNWSVQTVCFAEASASRFSQGLTNESVRKLIEFWRPDGCIVDCAGRPPDVAFSTIAPMPIVFLDCDSSEVGNRAVCVSSDAEAISMLAAKELLSLGFMDYSYVPHSHDVVWSRDRGEVFKDLVAMNGKKFHLCPVKLSKEDVVETITALSRWLLTLPRPCGIFAVNDYFADIVVRACVSAGISVPEEIAIIGVDNDEQICENGTVSISSICTDHEYSGYLSAELLAKSFSPSERTKLKSGFFGTIGVCRRASTRLFGIKDVRVRRALEFIRCHACERITVTDVVCEMGCSRRFADSRFKEIVGHTILDEIRSVRIDRVKHLLVKPNQNIASIPDFCGYPSLSVLCREFKGATGFTLREWRRKNPSRDCSI